MRPVGLRARLTAGFAAGALGLAAAMAIASYLLIRGSLLDERERTAIRAAYFNASVVQAGLTADEPAVAGVLRSLDTGNERHPVVWHDGGWYARDIDEGVTDAIPAVLLRVVTDGQAAVQRVTMGGRPAIVVGVPLSPSSAFFQIDSWQELDRTFYVLALVLTLVATVTAGGGAALGGYGARYVLRPLSSVATAAQTITAGDFSARLDPAAEPDLARLTTSFNRMVDQLSQRMERDRRFAADVSHELRSPLQTLSAAASVLTRRQNELGPRMATASGLVADEIARFQRLVNDLLELARSDRPADRQPVDVGELARQVCRARGLPEELVTIGDGTDPTWYVDPRRVEQVLANLLDNAVAHAGGPAEVRLGHTDGLWYIQVDDEGQGVRPEDRSVIFDRFMRGRTASARGTSDGTGLGLAIVAQHAAAHGGRALVLDRPGGGARFRVELPRCAP
jgi:signal transduction histidine kinase